MEDRLVNCAVTVNTHAVGSIAALNLHIYHSVSRAQYSRVHSKDIASCWLMPGMKTAHYNKNNAEEAPLQVLSGRSEHPMHAIRVL